MAEESHLVDDAAHAKWCQRSWVSGLLSSSGGVSCPVSQPRHPPRCPVTVAVMLPIYCPRSAPVPGHSPAGCPALLAPLVGEMGVPRVQVLEPALGGHGGSRGLRLGVCGMSWNGKRLRDEMMGGGDSRYRQGHGKRLGGRSDLRASLLAW